jgi:hypothetical protein
MINPWPDPNFILYHWRSGTLQISYITWQWWNMTINSYSYKKVKRKKLKQWHVSDWASSLGIRERGNLVFYVTQYKYVWYLLWGCVDLCTIYLKKIEEKLNNNVIWIYLMLGEVCNTEWKRDQWIYMRQN